MHIATALDANGGATVTFDTVPVDGSNVTAALPEPNGPDDCDVHCASEIAAS